MNARSSRHHRTKSRFVLIIKGRLSVGLFLLLISNLGWILPILVIPLLPISLEHKTVYIAIAIIFGQVSYNLGLFIAGTHVVKILRDRRQDLRLFWVQFKTFFLSLGKFFRRKR